MYVLKLIQKHLRQSKYLHMKPYKNKRMFIVKTEINEIIYGSQSLIHLMGC